MKVRNNMLSFENLIQKIKDLKGEHICRNSTHDHRSSLENLEFINNSDLMANTFSKLQAKL